MAAMKPLMRLINQSPAYAIAAPSETIHFVASRDAWAYCESRLRAATLMGFDTETKPVFYKGAKQNPCSLLQIATRDAVGKEEVFVIDLLTLQPKMYNSALCEVFLSKSVIKLGQGFFQDLKELAQSYPRATCFRVAKSVVEVNDLSVVLVGGGHLPLSLQKLVFLYLHRKLTKTQQTSNWNRRPLAPSQLHYAAADALVLLHLFDELTARIARTQPGFALDSVANVLDVHVPPAPKCSLCFSAFASLVELKKHRKECTASVHTLEICVGCDEKKLVTAEEMEQHMSECSEAGSDNATRVVVKALPKAPAVARKRSRSVTEETAGGAATTATNTLKKPTTAVTGAKPAKPIAKQAAAAAAAAAKPVKADRVHDQQQQLKQACEQQRMSRGQKKAQRKARKKTSVAQRIESTAKLEIEPTASRVAAAAADLQFTSTMNDADAVEAAKNKRILKKQRQRQRRIAEAAVVATQAKAETQTQMAQQTPLKRRKMSVESSLLASDAMWSQVSSDHSTSMFSP